MYYIWTLFSKYINRGLLNVLGKIWNISITNHTVIQATILFKKHSTICVDISTRQTDLFAVCINYRDKAVMCHTQFCGFQGQSTKSFTQVRDGV